MENKEGKRTVADIIIDRFLSEVDKYEKMPWQRPYEVYNSFNYITKNVYRGINRLVLPFGEYLTKNQINAYNKEHGTNYRFKKGIKWYPVVFKKVNIKDVTLKELLEKFPEANTDEKNTYYGRADNGYMYYMEEGQPKKKKNILRFFDVADRKFFVDENGECLPSRIEIGEIEIVNSKPKEVFDNYIERSGVELDGDYGGIPCYNPSLDKVSLNPYVKSEDSWFSTAFHELAHSTGHKTRLNRIGVSGKSHSKGDSTYAVEECIAEIAAGLVCAECGINSFVTSGTNEFQNNQVYIAHWKKQIKDWGSEFIYIVSQADKAFNYIMGDDGEDIHRLR